MIPEDNKSEQDRKLEEMEYSPIEDIFNREEHIPLDGDGNPLNPNHINDEMPYGLDVPGAEDDDNFGQINDRIPDEENTFHRTDDDYQEESDDVIA